MPIFFTIENYKKKITLYTQSFKVGNFCMFMDVSFSVWVHCLFLAAEVLAVDFLIFTAEKWN
jgi:hypothetical protein